MEKRRAKIKWIVWFGAFVAILFVPKPETLSEGESLWLGIGLWCAVLMVGAVWAWNELKPPGWPHTGEDW